MGVSSLGKRKLTALQLESKLYMHCCYSGSIYVSYTSVIDLAYYHFLKYTDAFKFTAMKSSSTQDYFRFSENPVFERMNSFMQKYNTDTNKIGAQKVINGYAVYFYRKALFDVQKGNLLSSL